MYITTHLFIIYLTNTFYQAFTKIVMDILRTFRYIGN